MKRRGSRLLAYLLTLVMIATSSMTAFAEENITVSDNNSIVVEEVSGEDVVEEGSEEELNDAADAEDAEDMSEAEEAADTAVEVGGGTVSDNEMPVEESDEPQEGLLGEMPDTYQLTAEQKESKKLLADCMGEFDGFHAGAEYAEKEVVFSTDSEEEAQMVADVYGTLESYFDGVAVIKLKEDVTVKEALRAAADQNVKLPAVWPNYYRYLTADIDEMMAEPNSFGVNDPYLDAGSANYQWQHYAVGSFFAWNARYKGQGVKVAVIDSGLDSNHEDIKGVQYYNAITGTEGSAPEKTGNHGHGTHVAGIIGAVSNNGKGGSGIAPEAQIYGLKVFDGAGAKSSDIARAINHATNTYKVDLINMSLGGPGCSGDEYAAILNAINKGTAIIAAAGNDGSKTKSYPAAIPEVICVAATDKNNARASFSNYGAWVDLCAPGVDIYSTLPTTINTAGYGFMSGTSQATPVVTGTAAVVLSANPAALQGKTGKDRVTALEKLLKGNVTKGIGGSIGAGIVNLPKALKIPGVLDKPAKPVMNQKTMTTDQKQLAVEIKCTANCTLYYSTDGKTPTMKNGEVINAIQAAGSVATVTVDGTVKGKATVKAIAVNKYTNVVSPAASITITFKPKVDKVTITGSTTKLVAGKSLSLTAAVEPSYAANKAVDWTITGEPNKTGVSVKNGKVTATAKAVPGTYTVTATPKDGKGGTPGTYSVTVVAAANVKSVKFTPTKVTLKMKSNAVTYNMTSGMTATKADGSNAAVSDFVWTSSKPEVATVNKTTGVVTTKAAGTTIITALAADGSGVKATRTVVVEQQATTIQVEQPIAKENVTEVSLAAGKSVQLKTVVYPLTTKDKAVVWSISGDQSEVTISKSGKVSAKATANAGTYTVTATAKNDSSVQGKILVRVYSGKTESVSLDKKTATIFRQPTRYNVATSTKINVTTTGSAGYNSDYTVTNSNPNLVTVSKSGKTITVTATGKATGSSTIKVMMNDGSGKSATCKVTVKNPISKLSIAPEAGRTADIGKGKTLKLSAVFEEEFGKADKKVKWSVISGKDYAQVSSGGIVKALKGLNGRQAGQAVIQAEAADGSGIKATYVVYTYEVVTSIGFYNAGEDDTGGYVMEVYYNGGWSYGSVGTTHEISVEVSNPNVAIIDNSYAYGEFTVYFIDYGTVTITVKAMDGSGKKASKTFRVG